MSSARRSALLVTLVLLLGGCGGGVTPRAWAGKVCLAVGTWRVQVDTLTLAAQKEMAGTKTVAAARTSLVTMLGGSAAASDVAKAGVSAAGVPDVADGRKLTDQLTGAIGAARDAYGKAKTAVEQLPTTVEKTFYDGVELAMGTLKKEYDPGSADPAKLASPELAQAYQSVCR